MDSMEYQLNGVSLDSENCLVSVGSTLIPSVSTVRTVVQVPGMDGSVDAGMPVFDERTATLQVYALEPSVFAESSRIMRLCGMPSLTLTRVKNGVMQDAPVRLSSIDVDDDDSHPRYMAPFTVVFAIPGVWFRSRDYMLRQVSSSGGLLLPPTGKVNNDAGYYTMWLGLPDASESLLWDELEDGYFSDAPIPDAVIRFPKNVTAASVKDSVSGTGLSWSGSAADSYLYLDAGRLTAWRSPSSTAWDGGTAVAGLDYPAEGVLRFCPDVDGSYRCDVSLSGSSDDVVVRFKQSWW